MITFVVAMDQEGLIGVDNELPWHLPADLQHFKKVTMGKPIVMGRKTYESIGRPLPGRENIVMTRQPSYHIPGCTIVHTLKEVLERDEEVCVIGGAHLFQQFMPYVDEMYITEIEETFEGDTYFPEFAPSQWELLSEQQGITDEKNVYPHRFLHYKKKQR
ncbi:dihydrofolate reductase [Fictibacillus macauensis ZFHKF-1]|uniref:Dihydrofolate reductase n=1 Tax=Fictibacillus macauensis ZFHKF-1 TaxID=1196324 RepID=I8UJW3_9BACL|nr:dihydrofolate reductase [Fictibacillus macauensis]EIT87170.1 dihydrofolate reductase [Fictibacillus macauensis ZFHKF-1]